MQSFSRYESWREFEIRCCEKNGGVLIIILLYRYPIYLIFYKDHKFDMRPLPPKKMSQ